MRTIVELSEEDIIQAIANAFDVDANKVTLSHKKALVGYAQNEHEEQVVTATVTLKNGGAEG